MSLVSAYPVIAFTRRCNRHQRRAVRRVRLTSFPASSNLRHFPRFTGAGRAADAAADPKTVLQIGHYVLGDESCPLLYGPEDIRY
ncbi:hypothetical protein [Hymenobacter rigui]|uniref:Uncharacterized protein n=1 Tax=Hymenobacter rigui TaxID=334424 RepID=A0A428KSQ8_9BACT|nr:hypothetical protein [Hymenobacter rigui]RSK49579.1 hypothetical protein EI291_08810 [Hymenobacter rigui]